MWKEGNVANPRDGRLLESIRFLSLEGVRHMKTVYKYKVLISQEFTLELPVSAQVLFFAVQVGIPQIWVLVDTDAPAKERKFYLAETGREIDPEIKLSFIGTCLRLHGSEYVLHLFEVLG